MAGWNQKKVTAFRAAFEDFLKHLVIVSKEADRPAPLKLYGSQKRFLDEIFEGLGRDIHFFVVLKARQLGISTITRALIVFWAFMHPGLRVGLVYDTDANKEDARAEIDLFLQGLPTSHRVPKKYHNRYHCEFENGSRISYFVAGVKKTKSSNNLGQSRGINCLGATECRSWGDVEGLLRLERTLAEKFENRLYIWESTAGGFGIFYQMWERARVDDLTKKCIFIGWWANELYSHQEGTPLFERYGSDPPTEEEEKKIDIVAKRYGHSVTMEQLAWYRHQHDPNRADIDNQSIDQEVILQELPWYEEESWLMSGSQFFPSDRLTEAMKEAKQQKVKGFNYYMNEEFIETVVEPARIPSRAWLKIWQEPDSMGSYVVAADPAYGSDDDSYNHCAQVLRCYADSVEQVAEFCAMEPDTRQFAWALLHLCGAYKANRFMLEINGPGTSVWTEIRNLKTIMTQGYLRRQAAERGLENIFDSVRDYLFVKEDSIAREPQAFHWVTNTQRKVQIMERMRALFNLGALKIRSLECLSEMHRVVRDGDTIKGDGTAKYDRVMAMALACRVWEDTERKRLIGEGRTKEIEDKRRDLRPGDLYDIFTERLVGNFFQQQRRDRLREHRLVRRGSRWRW